MGKSEKNDQSSGFYVFLIWKVFFSGNTLIWMPKVQVKTHFSNVFTSTPIHLYYSPNTYDPGQLSDPISNLILTIRISVSQSDCQ